MLHPATLVLSSLAALISACAQSPAKAPAARASTAVPAALQTQPGEVLNARILADGVQIYECRADKDKPGSASWAFVAPEADLQDEQGKPIGRHYAGPHWEAQDGSKIVGSVKARAPAPQAGDIPWLLLGTRSVGPAGRFAGITSIQRVDTEGGEAPGAAACTPATLGKTERIGYRAVYLLFSQR